MRVTLTDRFPHQRSGIVKHEYRCRGQAVAVEVENAVLPRNFRITVCVDDWELRDEVFHREFGASQIVGAKRDYFGICAYDLFVVLCQIDELAAAEGSPESPIEDQHRVLIAADLR